MQKQKADSDIENGKYEKVYLIFGDEPYLIRAYKNKLKQSIIPEQENMNYAYFDSLPDNIEAITGFADTMPFFGDRRLVILDKTSAAKKDNGLADYIPSIPDTTTMIIVEDEIDKRSKLYKAVQKYGCVMELKKLSMQDIKLYVVSRLKKAGKGITERDCEYLIESVGEDLNTLMNEVDKCIAYSGDGKAVDRKCIDTVCSMQIENKVFDMVDAMIRKDGSTAFRLYGDLLSLRENAFGIMAIIRKNYLRMLMVRELMDEGCSYGEIASRAKMPDWLVKKEAAKVREYKRETFEKALNTIVNTENDIKIGNISEQMGMELMIKKLIDK